MESDSRNQEKHLCRSFTKGRIESCLSLRFKKRIRVHSNIVTVSNLLGHSVTTSTNGDTSNNRTCNNNCSNTTSGQTCNQSGVNSANLDLVTFGGWGGTFTFVFSSEGSIIPVRITGWNGAIVRGVTDKGSLNTTNEFVTSRGVALIDWFTRSCIDGGRELTSKSGATNIIGTDVVIVTD